MLLATLARGDALTQRELARRMPSDPSTVRAMLVLLERQGLVQRDVHPSDSRARTVGLTVAGKRKFRQVLKAGEAIRVKMVEAIEPHDVAQLVTLLSKIAEALMQQTRPRLHPVKDSPVTNKLNRTSETSGLPGSHSNAQETEPMLMQSFACRRGRDSSIVLGL